MAATYEQRRVCSECGMTSTPGGIGNHQRATGHTGWVAEVDWQKNDQKYKQNGNVEKLEAMYKARETLLENDRNRLLVENQDLEIIIGNLKSQSLYLLVAFCVASLLALVFLIGWVVTAS